MAYTPNSMNANGVNEGTFQELYTQNKEAIDAYVRAHPGGKDPREAAFKAVTGQPWPEGRGVNSSGQMTKDRTVKSVLGKYVAPIAAGVAAPFALPALLGAGGAAGASGLAADVGSAMAVPGTVGTAAGAGAGSTIAAIAGKAAAGKSIMDRISGAMHGAAPVAATAINAATQQAANNRGEKLKHEDEVARLKTPAQDAFERQLIARAEEDRNAEKDARARVTQDEYNINRKPLVAPTIQSNVAGVKPQQLTNWGIGRTAGPTQNEIAGLTSDRDRARDRLMAGSSLPPVMNLANDPYYTQPSANLNPGKMERIGQIAGPAISIWDKISKYL